MKFRNLAITVAALAVAAPVLAQDPPPPDLQSEEAILNWARAARLTDDTAEPRASWQIMGALDEGLLWSSIQAPPDANGIARVGVRLERFRPDGTVRSEAALYELDCNKNLVKATHDAKYPEHNFGGAAQPKALSGSWDPLANYEIVAAFRDDACAARAAPARTAAIDISNPAVVNQWLSQNGVRDRDVGLSAGQWSRLGVTGEGVIFSILGDRDSQTQTAILNVRLERFEPVENQRIQSSLSEVVEYEFNCRQERVRKISTMQYVNHNLQGRNDGQRRIEEWVPIAQHPLLAAPGAGLCQEMQGQRRQFLR